MTSTNKQITDQLAKLSLVFEPPMPRTIGSDPNPRYAALVAVYAECLQPFHPWELEAGIKLALESHKYAKWPKPAELRDYCMSARLDMKSSDPAGPDKRLPPCMLNKPERREMTAAERERVKMKIQVRQEWEANGKYMAKNPDGSWRYDIADLNREADSRIAGGE